MKRLIMAILSIANIITSCSEYKTITTGNQVYTYVNNLKDRPALDTIIQVTLNKPIKAKIEEKTDYVLITPKPGELPVMDPFNAIIKLSVDPSDVTKWVYKKKIYYPETDHFSGKNPLRYREWKLALQTLSVPIKIRPRLGNDTTYPSQVETGVNIGFAPVIKHSWSAYNPARKVMGKTTSTWSIATGPLFSIGATDLKKSGTNPGNAPGIPSDRKSAFFSYGGFLIFGFNNINVGYAIGGDAVLGKGSTYWKYQGVYWHGVIVALDIIK